MYIYMCVCMYVCMSVGMLYIYIPLAHVITMSVSLGIVPINLEIAPANF